MRAAAVPRRRVAARREPYPVLIFAPAGFPPICLSTVVEEIASHGYVVVGVNPTHESTTVFPDGRVVPMNAQAMRPVMGPYTGMSYEQAVDGRAAVVGLKAADMRFVADRLEGLDGGAGRLAGSLDLARLGAFGHSMGGTAALEFCRRDGRCLAGANLDGGNCSEVGWVGIARPALQILADHTDLARACEESVRGGRLFRRRLVRGRAEADARRVAGGPRRRPARPQRDDPRRRAHQLHGHPLPAGPPPVDGGGRPRAGEHRPPPGLAITCDLLLAFFARHLTGAPAPLLDDLPAAYPEVWAGPPRSIPEHA